jgi:hypothetical protein
VVIYTHEFKYWLLSLKREREGKEERNATLNPRMFQRIMSWNRVKPQTARRLLKNEEEKAENNIETRTKRTRAND